MRRSVAAGLLLLVTALAGCGGAEPARTTPTTAGLSGCRGAAWLGAWAAAPSDAAGAYVDQTLRLVLTPLRSGSVARVRLSNRFGTRPLQFTDVHLGRQRHGAALVPGSNRAVRFAGRRQVTIPSGGEAVSDAVRMPVTAFRPLAVSVYTPVSTGPATEHADAQQTSYVAAGSRGVQTGAAGLATRLTTRPFVTGLDVRAPRRDGVVAAVGDSITDGAEISPATGPYGLDGDTRYPDFLARRLAARPGGPPFSVLNLGISGNRVLGPGAPAAGAGLLARLGPDVLARPDVTDVILLEGINDLGQGASAGPVVDGLREAVRRLHAAHRSRPLHVLVGTLTPAGGAAEGPAYAESEAARSAVNRAIRAGGIGDGVVDFDRALRDPAHPDRLAPRFDGGDHLHPSAAGYERMAAAVPLSALRGARC